MLLTKLQQIFRNLSGSVKIFSRSVQYEAHHQEDFEEPIHPIPGRQPQYLSASEAVKAIKSNDKIFVHGIAATPTPLLNALCDHAKANDLKNINLYHILLEGEARWTAPEFKGVIESQAFVVSENVRSAIARGQGDTIVCFLQDIPLLFHRRKIDLDVALIQVTPPDAAGFCSLGVSVDIARAALQHANHVIAMVNSQMPRTSGDGTIHCSHIDVMVCIDQPLHFRRGLRPLSPAEKKIGELIAENLIADGATIQDRIPKPFSKPENPRESKF